MHSLGNSRAEVAGQRERQESAGPDCPSAYSQELRQAHGKNGFRISEVLR